MSGLPVPVALSTIPDRFSPSQLVTGEHCLLRVVLAATPNVPALVAHPAAAIGSAFHELLEMAARGEIARLGGADEDASRALDRVIDEKQLQLSQVSDVAFPELRNVFPPLIWRRKRRAVLDLAVRYMSAGVASVPPKAKLGGRSARDLPPVGTWPELWLDTPKLRLRGRADIVERKPGVVVIRDVKTGRVLDAEGEVSQRIARQLRLYGLMALELWPTAEIRLVVDSVSELNVSFAAAEQNDARTWLNLILDRLPAGEAVLGDALATPGEACEGCSYRHVCPTYRGRAPEFWSSDSRVRMPLDTWGEVVEIRPQSNERCDVQLIDAAGRNVKVFGLARARVEGVGKGGRLWLFGLRTRDRRGGPEWWRHPRNFFEATDDDSYAHAWTLQSFEGAQ